MGIKEYFEKYPTSEEDLNLYNLSIKEKKGKRANF
jgi:hypothetical protein